MLDKLTNRMHPVTLAFTNALFEKEYREYRLEFDLWYMRIAALLGGLIYGGYAYIDYLLYGELFITPASVRLGLVMPVSLICFALSFTPEFKNFHTIQFTSITLLVFAHLGALLMSSLPFIIPAFFSISTMMILIYTTSMGRILVKYQYAFIFFIIASLILFGIFDKKNSYAIDLFQIMSVSTVAATGLIAAYLLERNDRIDFFQKKIIELQNDHLKLSNGKQTSLIDKLQYLNDDLRKFTYMASHDLKTPVRGIATLIQFLENEIPSGNYDDIEEYLTLMNQNIQKIDYLVAGIGKYVDAGIEHKSQWTDPHIILEKIARPLTLTGEAELSLPDHLPKVFIHDKDLKFVFQELITNSIKHQLPQLQPRICISSEETEEGLFLYFKDNGPGIAPQYHERVFKIFETLSNEKKQFGSGIGLSIVKKILAKYRSNVFINEHQNGISGTMVTLFFPEDLLYHRKNFWDGKFQQVSRISSDESPKN